MSPEKTARLKSVQLSKDVSMLEALRKMDELGRKLLVVVEGARYTSLLSVGDIQRAIIANRDLETPVGEVVRGDVRVAHVDEDEKAIKALMLRLRTEFMPVVNDGGEIVDVYFWDDTFAEAKPKPIQIDVPVIVMAGGKATRLKPFSNVLPKALFPVGEKTMIECIMDRFCESGCRSFVVSVNYKHEFIRAHFEHLENHPYTIEYIQEDRPLGTVGSLHLVKDRLEGDFFVTNCDIIVDADYSDILKYHREHQNEITIISALKQFKIPYGTLRTTEGGEVVELVEKPEHTYKINSGLYVLNASLLEEISAYEFLDFTDLIDIVRGRAGRVGAYPIGEKSWFDIGEWAEYWQTIGRFDQGMTE